MRSSFTRARTLRTPGRDPPTLGLSHRAALGRDPPTLGLSPRSTLGLTLGMRREAPFVMAEKSVIFIQNGHRGNENNLCHLRGGGNLKKPRVFAISGFLGLLGASMLAYMGDPGPKRPPRGSQEASRGPQEAPKRTQEAPKRPPNLCHFQLFKFLENEGKHTKIRIPM